MKIIEWYEHPKVTELDDWFDDMTGDSLKEQYRDLFIGVSCVADLKYDMEKLIQNIKSDLDTALDILDEFEDDDTVGEYEVEDDA